MKINSMDRLFVHTLKDVYSAEKQIIAALPKMIEAASSPELKEAMETHLEETKNQLDRVNQIFEHLDFSPTGHPCLGMKGIIEEAQEIIDDNEIPSLVKDAALIEAAQKVEHYEIASYGTAVHFANLLGDEEAADLLSQTLEEEKETDKKLTQLAEENINIEALEEGEKQRPSMQ